MSMKASPVIHALPYPTLEAGNLSFPNGDYQTPATIGKDGHSVEIEHQISNAPFLEKLIKNGDAKFGCLLSIPKVGFRELSLSDSKSQTIEWAEDITGEPPKLRPVLLYTGAEKKYKLTAKDGVAKIWQGKKVNLIKGAKLARANFLNVRVSEHSFLRFKKSDDYEPGTFTVKANTEEGFYFTVTAAKDVFGLVQGGQNPALRLAVLTNAVTQCFAILKDDYKESDDDSFDSFSNLRVLSEKLHSKLGHDWNNDEFDSLLAATSFHPINIESSPDEEDE